MKAGVVAALLLCGRLASAQDAFEIQVYDTATAPRGEAGLEVHLNYHAISGAPDETHLTFEPHYGLADWAELGGYFQTSLSTTGDAAYAGVKLRMKLRWPHRLAADRLGLALNGELSAIPSRFEPAVWGSEVRPIIDFTDGRFYASVNPIVTIDLRGDAAGHPQLEPCAKLAIRVVGEVAVGVEAYGGYGPIDDLGSEHFTRVLAALDVKGTWWDLNAGVGGGWGSTDRVVAKLILGFHPVEPH